MGLTEVGAAGLSDDEARRRRHEHGPNAVAEETRSRLRVFLAKFWAPIPWMLEAAIVLQIVTGEYIEAVVIAALLLFNATLSFIQEGRANAVLAALKKRLAPTAFVRRDGAWVRRPAEDLVPGDVIRLPLGAVVPADARIVSSSVTVDQSMLTGESVPVDVSAGGHVYAGSMIRRGQAVAEVTATGAKTYFGRAADLVRIAGSASTEQAAIFSVTRNLIIVNGTVGILILVYAYALALPVPDLIRLALTALLASIPVALPTTFTLSAALGANTLARKGVLLTRLSAAHEAAAMDVLCADKTGTLTRNALQVVEVHAMPGFDRARVLALATLASSEADQDPIDAAVRTAAGQGHATTERPLSFVPFDPATRVAEAVVLGADGQEQRVIKGAFETIAVLARQQADASRLVNDLAQQGHRVIAVAAGRPGALLLAGFIAISDPPREDSAAFIATLRGLGVRTVMVTGDSATTAAAIARKVGVAGAVSPSTALRDDLDTDEFDVFARVLPEEKYRLVKALQGRGHVVGMCGDGTNDAPALRQAQIGIAVSSATDVAKAAAGMVMTEPGLAGIVFAVQEGRIAFGRLVTYTLNMLLKKTEIVLFLAIGLALTGHAVMTPVLMVLMLMTNDFLAMSLTTDRASPATMPSVWRTQDITKVAIGLGTCKLLFSVAALALGKYAFVLSTGKLQTLAFVTLVFGAQAALYVVRERRRFWASKPSGWVLAASTVDVVIVSTLAVSGTLMDPLDWRLVAATLAAAAGLALILDQIKLPLQRTFRIE